MSSQIDRARALYDLDKYEQAEKVLRELLRESPDFGYAHSLLAICLSYTGKHEQAKREAEQGVACAPETAYSHFSLAISLLEGKRFEEALTAIEETNRLAPAWDAGFSLKGRILMFLERWQDALETAEQGLALNPENVECMKTRGIALLELGRETEAESVIRTALEHNPDDAETHTCLGWVVLNRDSAEAALPHFREALRLEPDHRWALRGVEKALRFRSPIYRRADRCLVWLGRCSALTQGFMILGFISLACFILFLIWVEFPPGLKWIGTLFPALYFLALVIVLTPSQLLNLNLRKDQIGKNLQSKSERIGAKWIGAYLLLSFPAACLQLKLSADPGGAIIDVYSEGFLDWVLYFCYVLPLSITFRARRGWPHWLMMMLMTAITIIGYGGLILATVTRSSSLAQNSLLIAVLLACASLIAPETDEQESAEI